MDKSWMNIYDKINDIRYEAGVIEFLDFAYRGRDESLAIPCPCRSCNNFRDKNLNTLRKLLDESHEELYAGCQTFSKKALPTPSLVPKNFYEAKKYVRDLEFGGEKIHDFVNDCILYRNKLQRLFIDKQVASDMRWHKEKQVRDDNIARHPADTEAWKHLDKIDPPIACDPCNIRLGLAKDGFNPFGNLSNPYSIWPVFIVPYNLPPWKCMKDPYMFMSMLIPGPKTPVNIDVYFEPLIDELKDLWVGVDAYDELRKEDFTLRAALLWTINDFSAYGMLSGWSDKTNFDGLVDNRAPIAPKSGDEVLHDIECSIGVLHSMVNKKKHKYLEGTKGWNKKSVLFNLPYLSKLKVRHNINIMHIVKNVTESLTGTLFNIKGKTKDTWKSRQDLMDRGLKKSLHLQRRGESVVIPMACYHLTKDEKHKISNLLMSLKFPDGLASNISRGSLTKEVRLVIYELSEFIRIICSWTMHLNILEKLEEKIIVILCKLERMFPPSFFDIMTHLLIHLPYEAKISGPPEYRWMFPFERKMHVLKGYVTNKARPEGCIAQRYIENECVTFCSMYLNDVDTVFNKSERNDEMIHPGGEISVFSSKGRPIGGYKSCDLSEAELIKIHTYILNNCPEMGELINEHKVELEEENFNHVNERHDKEFASWLQQRVNTHLHSVASEIRILSRGPLNSVNSYSGCMVNGYKFHTQTREENRTCQNSGVVVKGDHGSSVIDYFGILQEVLEVEDYDT
ncbi:uncharacterized protein Tco_1409830 [Tanacetum coccineum]